jgi:hypothetical protein
MEKQKDGIFTVQHKKNIKEIESKNLEDLLKIVLKTFIEKREKAIEQYGGSNFFYYF